MLSYNRVFDKVHDVNAMFLYNQKDYDKGETLPYRSQGIAGRFSYTYDSRYIAELNFGYNGSENFAPGKRFGFFPAVAVGWIASQEKFMQPLSDVISNLKLRASWGDLPIFLLLLIRDLILGVRMRTCIVWGVQRVK